MKNLMKITLLLLFIAFYSLKAADLDMNYIKNFGWGKTLVSEKGYPPVTNCDMSMFNYSDGKFTLTADKDVKLNFRHLLKDGKTYGYYLDQLKKNNAKKYKTKTSEFLRTYVLVSHENGNEAAKNWPKTLSDIPEWTPLFVIETNCDATVRTWNCSGLNTETLGLDNLALSGWIYKAMPGYKIYIYNVCGFIREAPESKFWDKDQLTYVTPIEYVETEPLAAGTVEVTASNNPLMAWTYTVTSMPQKNDGESTGTATLYKDGAEMKKVNFTIKPQGSPNTWDLMVMDVIDGTGFYGGFQVTDPTIEGAVKSAIYQLIDSGLQNGYLPE